MSVMNNEVGLPSVTKDLILLHNNIKKACNNIINSQNVSIIIEIKFFYRTDMNLEIEYNSRYPLYVTLEGGSEKIKEQIRNKRILIANFLKKYYGDYIKSIELDIFSFDYFYLSI